MEMWTTSWRALAVARPVLLPRVAAAIRVGASRVRAAQSLGQEAQRANLLAAACQTTVGEASRAEQVQQAVREELAGVRAAPGQRPPAAA